jgi:flavodoxin
MKTIIVYYSFTGNNEVLAWKLQKRLNCNIQKIEEIGYRTNLKILLDMFLNRPSRIKESKIPITQPTNFIFIAPIWNGNVATPMKAFINMTKHMIHEYSFITICGGATGGQSEKIKNQLLQIVGKEPVAIEELKINDLLAFDKRNKIRNTIAYRINNLDLEMFQTEIENFVQQIENPIMQEK